MTDMGVRDPGTSLRPVGPGTTAATSRPAAAAPTRDGHARAAAATGPGPHRPGPVADRPRTKPDATIARLSAGAVGIAATAALVSAIAGGMPAAAAAPVTAAAPPASTAPVGAVTVRHVTKVVTLASDATPPPRKIVYATPVPAPPQQTIVVRTTQSGQVIP
jgi:hypothetical protein